MKIDWSQFTPVSGGISWDQFTPLSEAEERALRRVDDYGIGRDGISEPFRARATENEPIYTGSAVLQSPAAPSFDLNAALNERIYGIDSSPLGPAPTPRDETIGDVVGGAATDFGRSAVGFASGAGNALMGGVRGAIGGGLDFLADFATGQAFERPDIMEMGRNPFYREPLHPSLAPSLQEQQARMDQYRDEFTESAESRLAPVLGPTREITDILALQADENRRAVAESRPDDMLGGWTYDLTTSLAQMFPALATTAITKSPNAGLTQMFAQVFGNEYQQGASATESMLRAGFEVVPEKMSGVFERFVNPQTMNRLKQSVAEGGTEVVTEALNQGYDAMKAGGYEGSYSDLVADLLYAGSLGAGMGAVIGPNGRPQQIQAPPNSIVEPESSPALTVDENNILDLINSQDQGETAPNEPAAENNSQVPAQSFEQELARQRKAESEELDSALRREFGWVFDQENNGDTGPATDQVETQAALPQGDNAPVSNPAMAEALAQAQREAQRGLMEQQGGFAAGFAKADREAEQAGLGSEIQPSGLMGQQTPVATASAPFPATQADPASIGLNPIANEAGESQAAPREALPSVQLKSGGTREWSDMRLRREEFRGRLALMSGELKRGGGGMGRINTNTGDRPADTGDWMGVPSENPAWAQAIIAEGATVAQIRRSFDKALKGEKLGERQANIVESALEYISAERMGADFDRGYGPETVPEVLETRRDEVRPQRGELTNQEVDQKNFEISEIIQDRGLYESASRAATERLNQIDAESSAVLTTEAGDNFGDRRITPEERAEIARKDPRSMTRNELLVTVLSNELTGINGRRAFETALESHEGEVVSIDADNLKWINDNLSPTAGDSLLVTVARSLYNTFGDRSSFHVSGDEFYVLPQPGQDAGSMIAEVNQALANAEVEVTKQDGTIIFKRGLNITHGVGQNKEVADEALKAEKRRREASGERAGRDQEPAGVSRVNAGVPVTDRADGQGARDSSPRATQSNQDLAGDVDQTAQAVSDSDRARQQRVDQSPDMTQGDGELFAGPRPEQTDLVGQPEVEPIQEPQPEPEAPADQEPIQRDDDAKYSRAEGPSTVSIEQDGVAFETGSKVTFPFRHNTNSATNQYGVPSKDSPFGRGFEPSGRYVVFSSQEAGADRPEIISGTLTFENPLVIDNNDLNWKEQLSKQYGGLTGSELSQALISAGYDGVVTVDNPGSRREYVSEILDLTTFDPEIARYSREGADRDLYVAHNLSEQNLKHVFELGGIAAPSLAVVRSGVSNFDSFGEITLLADASLLDSPKVKTFDADVYSPRHPRAENKVEYRDLDKQIESFGVEYSLEAPSIDQVQERGAEALMRSPMYQYAWLKSVGKAPKPKRIKLTPLHKKLKAIGIKNRFDVGGGGFDLNQEAIEIAKEYLPEDLRGMDETDLAESRAKNAAAGIAIYDQSGGYNLSDFNSVLNKRTNSKANNRAFSEWAEGKLAEISKGQIVFDGYTPSGNRRYKKYDLDTVVSMMTKKLQGGENWNYGAGSVRSAYSKQFKNKKQIQGDRDRIVDSSEFDRIREESNSRLSTALEELRPYYKYSADGIRYMDDASEAIAEGPRGWAEAFDLDSDSRKIITDLVDYLKALPTEYFEAKAQRAVDLSEFAIAVVPKGTPKAITDQLRAKGLKVKRYDKSKDGDRAAVIAKEQEIHFSRGSSKGNQTPADVRKALNLTDRQADALSDILEIVQSVSDIPGRHPSNVAGAYMGGKAYIVADNADPQNARGLLFHEVGVHHGLKDMLGDEYSSLVNRIKGQVKRGGREKASRADRDAYTAHQRALKDDSIKSDDTLWEETIAYMAESGARSPALKQIIAKIKAFLRQFKATRFLAKDFNAADVAHLARGSVDRVVAGKLDDGAIATTYAPTMYQRAESTNQTKTPAFSAWFGDSKVVDANGEPLVVYHGGTAKNQIGPMAYVTPDMQAAESYASLDDGGNVQSLYASLQNPAEPIDLRSIANDLGIDADSVPDYALLRPDLLIGAERIADEAQNQGYDGAHFPMGEDFSPDGDAIESWVAFRPEQIKSATDNQGTFDPENPDIRYSRAEGAPSFQDFALTEREYRGEYLDPAQDTLTQRLKAKSKVAARRGRIVFQDSLLPVKEAVEQAREKGTVREFTEVYKRAENMIGKAGDLLDRMEENQIMPLVDKMREWDISQDQLGEYLYARHAKERNAQIAKINDKFADTEKTPGSGMSDSEADKILSGYDEKTARRLGKLANRVDAISEQTKKQMVDSGLIDPEMAKAWDDTYSNYVPLKGLDGEVIAMEGIGRGFDTRGTEARRALGRRSRAKDIVANVIADAQRAIIRSQKNEVGQSLLMLALENPNSNLWTVSPVKSDRRIDPATGKVVDFQAADTFGDDVYKVKVNGDVWSIKLDPQLARSMKNLGASHMNIALQATAKLNRWLSYANTALNPEFVITNFFRDFEQSMIQLNGERGAKMARAVAKDVLALGPAAGALHEISGEGVSRKITEFLGGDKTKEWSKWFERYRASGGKISYFRQESIPEQVTRINRLMSMGDRTAPAATRRAFKSVIDLVENLNGSVENAVRVATYKNAIESGFSETDAAHMARDLTVNFNRRGEWGVMMNSLFLFYNASIQGTARIFMSMKHKKVRRAIGYGMAANAALTVMNYMLAGEDEDGENRYEKIPDYEKARNLIIMTPGGEPVKIPLPYLYNAFMAASENAVAVAFGRNPAKATANVASAFVNSMNPLADESFVNTITPTVADPIMSIRFNENFFGQQIMPENPYEDYARPDSDKYWASVNPLALRLAKGLNRISGGSDTTAGYMDVSPETIEYMYDHFTGAAGAFVNRMITFGADPATAFAENKAPLLRKLYGANTTFYAQDQYKAAGQRLEAIQEARDRIERDEFGSYSEWSSTVKEFEEENSDYMNLMGPYQRTERRIRRLFGRRSDIMGNDRLSQDEKDQSIDELMNEIDKVRTEFLQKYNETFYFTGLG